jgi:hypothetical protein
VSFAEAVKNVPLPKAVRQRQYPLSTERRLSIRLNAQVAAFALENVLSELFLRKRHRSAVSLWVELGERLSVWEHS